MSELDTQIDTIAKQVAGDIDYEPRNFMQRVSDQMYAERDRILEERLVCCGECEVLRMHNAHVVRLTVEVERG